MYRRIGWTLVNLKQVVKIEASENVISYMLPVSHGGFFLFSGGVTIERLLEIYPNDQECAKGFNELAKQLTEVKSELK